MTSQPMSKPKAGEFDVLYQPGRGWIVIDPEGQQSERSFANRNAALTAKGFAAAQAARLARSKERPCITCGKPFMSEGAHNRMCTGCRGHRSAEADPCSFGAIHGRRKGI